MPNKKTYCLKHCVNKVRKLTGYLGSSTNDDGKISIRLQIYWSCSATKKLYATWDCRDWKASAVLRN
jgi:hypothetical protein